ncbi:MAG TPA: hypothetical protein VGY31_04350, partial [Terriglobia bacterium]|nr:hypothetical protein [Terriglobia bacterium]
MQLSQPSNWHERMAARIALLLLVSFLAGLPMCAQTADGLNSLCDNLDCSGGLWPPVFNIQKPAARGRHTVEYCPAKENPRHKHR